VWGKGAGENRPPFGYNVHVHRKAPLLAVMTLAALVAVGVSAAADMPITAKASGKVFRVEKGESLTLRLSHRWRWSEPDVSSAAVELTPVEYFVDPGFSEWTIDAHKVGRATIRAVGPPNCSTCPRLTRHFAVTIVVTARS